MTNYENCLFFPESPGSRDPGILANFVPGQRSGKSRDKPNTNWGTFDVSVIYATRTYLKIFKCDLVTLAYNIYDNFILKILSILGNEYKYWR